MFYDNSHFVFFSISGEKENWLLQTFSTFFYFYSILFPAFPPWFPTFPTWFPSFPSHSPDSLHSPHSHPDSLHSHPYSLHSHPIPQIPCIPHIPIPIPCVPTLIPCISIISSIPFPDSPFRLLQIALFCQLFLSLMKWHLPWELRIFHIEVTAKKTFPKCKF